MRQETHPGRESKLAFIDVLLDNEDEDLRLEKSNFRNRLSRNACDGFTWVAVVVEHAECCGLMTPL